MLAVQIWFAVFGMCLSIYLQKEFIVKVFGGAKGLWGAFLPLVAVTILGFLAGWQMSGHLLGL